jgi:hypothetical protein
MANGSGTRQIEEVLRACGDRSFAADLVARRSQAALERGFALGESDQAMLDAVSEPQLQSMIERLASRELAKAEPDEPPSRRARETTAEPGLFGGIRPDLPPEGERRHSPVRGHSACLPVVAAAGAVILAGGAVAATCCTHGMRADLPPDAGPRSGESSSADTAQERPKP